MPIIICDICGKPTKKSDNYMGLYGDIEDYCKCEENNPDWDLDGDYNEE